MEVTAGAVDPRCRIAVVGRSIDMSIGNGSGRSVEVKIK